MTSVNTDLNKLQIPQTGSSAAGKASGANNIEQLFAEYDKVNASKTSSEQKKAGFIQNAFLFGTKIDANTQTIGGLSAQNNISQSKINGLQQNNNTLTTDINAIQSANTTLANEIGALTSSNSALMAEANALNGLINQIGTQITQIMQGEAGVLGFAAAAGLMATKSAYEGKLQSLEQQIANNNNEIETKNKEQDKNTNVIETKSAEVEDNNKNIQNEQSVIAGRNNEITNLESNNTNLNTQKNDAQTNANNCSAEIQADDTQLAQISQEIKTAQEAQQQEQVVSKPQVESEAIQAEAPKAEEEIETEADKIEDSKVADDRNWFSSIADKAQSMFGTTEEQNKETVNPAETKIIEQENTEMVQDNTHEIIAEQGPIFNASGSLIQDKAIINDIVEAVTSYEEVGIEIDATTIASASTEKLDEIVDASTTQNIIKTTGSGKIMADINTFTSKKDIKENSAAVNDFRDNYSELNSYYSANKVTNLEVNAFLTISGIMYDDIAKGATYSTADLNSASNKASILMSTLETQTLSVQTDKQSVDSRFEESKTKTEAAINNLKNKFDNQANENKNLQECKIEFMSLTSNYRNTTTDSEKQEMISDMAALRDKAKEIEKNPDSQIYSEERLAIAA